MKEKINFNIAGVTHENRQGYIQYLRKHKNAFLIYVRENKNEYDENAIKILDYVPNGKCVPLGYVPRETAKKIAPYVDKGYKLYTHSYNIVGGYGLNLGVQVEVSLYMPSVPAVAYEYQK